MTCLRQCFDAHSSGAGLDSSRGPEPTIARRSVSHRTASKTERRSDRDEAPELADLCRPPANGAVAVTSAYSAIGAVARSRLPAPLVTVRARQVCGTADYLKRL